MIFDNIFVFILHIECRHKTEFFEMKFFKCLSVSFIILCDLTYANIWFSWNLCSLSKQKMHCVDLHIRKKWLLLFFFEFNKDFIDATECIDDYVDCDWIQCRLFCRLHNKIWAWRVLNFWLCFSWFVIFAIGLQISRMMTFHSKIS